jgi:hypothetical protein
MGSFGSPGLPGLPSGTGSGTRDALQPFGGGSFEPPSIPFGASSAVIVNRSIFHSYPVANGAVPIAPTTEGNTLVVVQMSQNWVSTPVFNNVCAGYPPGYFDDPPLNTQGNGFSGFQGDFPHGVNTGSAIAYFTNIAGGVTEISYPGIVFSSHQTGFIPTIGIVYELAPCLVLDLFSTAYADQPDLRTTPPDLLTYAVTGPPSGGLYISTIVYNYGGPLTKLTGAFSGVSSPWTLDYQEKWTDPTHAWDIAVASAIIDDTTGVTSGTQQAVFTWVGDDAGANYGAASIALFPLRSGGGTDNLAELSQFLPNVWITC